MWKYIYIEDSNIKKAIEKANELGQDKWEAFSSTLYPGGLAGLVKHVILLKRQK